MVPPWRGQQCPSCSVTTLCRWGVVKRYVQRSRREVEHTAATAATNAWLASRCVQRTALLEINDTYIRVQVRGYEAGWGERIPAGGCSSACLF